MACHKTNANFRKTMLSLYPFAYNLYAFQFMPMKRTSLPSLPASLPASLITLSALIKQSF